MGDVLTLIEKAQQNYDQTKAKELERKFKKNEFTLDRLRRADDARYARWARSAICSG